MRRSGQRGLGVDQESPLLNGRALLLRLPTLIFISLQQPETDPLDGGSMLAWRVLGLFDDVTKSEFENAKSSHRLAENSRF